MQPSTRMLKSTYKPSSSDAKPPLPPGWTEHKAPSGHLYYYNSETKQSTYTRPVETPKQDSHPVPSFTDVAEESNLLLRAFPPPGINAEVSWHQRHNERQDNPRREFQKRPPQQDRPKQKHRIPGAEPWLLVRTKLKRRFVYNPETGESLWKFPKDVMQSVLELDTIERERRERRQQQNEQGEVSGEAGTGATQDFNAAQDPRQSTGSSDEYEEVEVSEDDDGDEEEQSVSKRLRKGNEGASNGPVEFGEDDIAFQLAQMEAEAAGLDDDYYEEDLPTLSDEDARALFQDLLDDFKISPFTPWETIIAEGRIIEDDRYTVLGSMKARKEVFDAWSRTRAVELKEQRERKAEQDPRIPYFAFLATKATPKFYWQEFRRKYQKEPEMKGRKLTDKDREKWYREHINRLKLPESDRKKDLRKLLEELPVREMNRSVRMASLPGTILRDLRYIGLPAKVRDPLIEAFIDIAPDAPEEGNDVDPEAEARLQKGREERERRERALADRERAVREQKEKQRRELSYSKGVLREEEAELRRAMQVGREGLLSHLEEDVIEAGPSIES